MLLSSGYIKHSAKKKPKIKKRKDLFDDYFLKPFRFYKETGALFYEPDMAADLMGLTQQQFDYLRGIVIPVVTDQGYTQSQLCFLMAACVIFRIHGDNIGIESVAKEFNLLLMQSFLFEHWEDNFLTWYKKERGYAA